MKRANRFLAMAGAAALLVSAGAVLAQDNNPPPGGPGGGGRGGRGNFDPAQMQQRMMERVKEQLEVTSDDEWKAMEPLVTKVFEARRDAMAGGMRGMFGRGPRRGGDSQSGDQGNRPRFGPEPSAEEQALEKAIDSKASKEDLKAAMTKFRAAKKDKEAKVKAAQEDLRKVLSLRQEAIAVMNGWLD